MCSVTFKEKVFVQILYATSGPVSGGSSGSLEPLNFLKASKEPLNFSKVSEKSSIYGNFYGIGDHQK